MPFFVVTNSTVFAGAPQNNCTATYQSALAVAASSGGLTNPGTVTGLRRGFLNDILVGTNAAPADNYIEWEVNNVTAGTTVVWLGTMSSVSTGVLAQPFGDAAALASFLCNNASAETNLAVNQQKWYIGINQRASYRWIAAPGQELYWPAASSATGNNGLAAKFRSAAYTNTVTCTFMGSEQ